MKRFASMFLTIMMLLGFMAIPANATGETSEVSARASAELYINEDGTTSANIYGVNVGIDDTFQVSLLNAGGTLATTEYIRERTGALTSTTCRFEYYGRQVSASWKMVGTGYYPQTDQMPEDIKVTINGTDIDVDTKYIENFNGRWAQSIIDAETKYDLADKNTEVVADVEPTFVVSIPKVIDFGTLKKGTDAKPVPFAVSLKDALIESNARIIVTLDSDNEMKMSDKRGIAKLPFELWNKNGNVVRGNDFCSFGLDNLDKNLESTAIGSVRCDTSKLKAAGGYTGTMTFNISYQYNK